MPRFPWKQNQRLSCACLSVFLVTGHLSLFPFWTTSYLLTYPPLPTLQCAPAWMSRWCCSARGWGRAVLAHIYIFLSLFFVSLFFLCHYLPPPLLLKDDVYPVPNVLFLPPSIPRECLFSLYFSVVLPIFFSLLIVSCCTTVSDLVMYAPHVFDPPCTPVLCTLHNHPLLSLEVYLPLSLSFLFFWHPPIFPSLLWQQSRSSLLSSPIQPPFPSSNPKPWKLE